MTGFCLFIQMGLYCTDYSLILTYQNIVDIPLLILITKNRYILTPWEIKIGTSLVAHWLRICLTMRGTRVQALVQEDPTCHGATKPVRHNYWACALEPVSHNYWACALEPTSHNYWAWALEPTSHSYWSPRA